MDTSVVAKLEEGKVYCLLRPVKVSFQDKLYEIPAKGQLKFAGRDFTGKYIFVPLSIIVVFGQAVWVRMSNAQVASFLNLQNDLGIHRN